jgi:hypothetical protein
MVLPLSPFVLPTQVDLPPTTALYGGVVPALPPTPPPPPPPPPYIPANSPIAPAPLPPIPGDNGITENPAIFDFPDNGPYNNAPPKGPTPTGPFEYITIPRQPPVLPNTRFMPFTPFQQVEDELASRNIGGERIDLLNGSRIYRVRVQDLWRVDSDGNGPFIGRPPSNQWRFSITDPTLGVVALNDWMPLLG